MKILFLSFYFEPDLCAGSFRNSPLLKELVNQLDDVEVDVLTTVPNRYDSFKTSYLEFEQYQSNVNIHRINIPSHNSGLLGQIKSFRTYYNKVRRLTRGNSYDLVYASSSRLFTAFLGARIARKNKSKLYLDIRDIFRESIVEIFPNKLIKIGLDIALRPIENYTFKYASHINLVSRGFESYFSKYPATLSFFTNGIDDVFINNIQNVIPENNNQLKTIVYAGNIGEGQGLHKIIPQVAPRLFKHNYLFKIIGDGGKREELRKAIENNEICNVELIDPVDRSELIKKYKDADFLFLHLNDYQAFERVLPSKLFEYATFPVPIIAGVGGYASRFIKEELTNYVLFEPNDGDGLVNQLENFKYNKEHRESFIQKYERETINKKMAQSILSYLND